MDRYVFVTLTALGIVACLVGAVLFLDYWLRRHLDRNNDGIIDDWEEAHPETPAEDPEQPQP